ncbi:MAG: hypothetical protein JWP12_1310 [Bacteroidetes bacterium]|nr:hypothetical protein [Bacteroidota bacterium]
MDKKQIRKEITTLINSIKEYSDSIRDKENIPQLELELLLHKVEKLHQKSIVLNYLNSVEEETAVTKPVETPEKTVVPPVVEPPKTEAPKEEKITEKPEEKAPEKETPKAEPKAETVEEKPVKTEEPKEEPKVETAVTETPKPEVVKTETPVETPKAEVKPEEPKKEIPKPEVKQEVKPEDKKPVDLFGSEIPVVEKPKAEKKPEKKEEKLPTLNKIQKPPVSDIRAAIGINDKFQFANELFAGEMKEYDIAIQQLNSAETMESASEYFRSLEQLYGWDPESETVKRLYDLVDRRYTSY